MAATIVVSCPQCKKEIKAPAELAGKKIRCKACSHIFAVRAPAASKPGSTTAVGKAKTPPGRAKKDDEWSDANPYDVTDFQFVPRCPSCAKEMESEEAIICIHCGYNTQTRQQLETRKTIATTGAQQFIWILPGIVCAVVALSLFGFAIWCLILFASASPDDKPVLYIWAIIGLLFGTYIASRFAIKRLIFNPKPPERETK